MTKQLEKVYTLDTDSIASGKGFHFIVIGAGGTGGYLVPHLARQISINNEAMELHRFTIADADEVELKNLVRQNFIQRDIGQNKASVLANRYSSAFGTEIGIVNRYIESDFQLKSIIDLYTNTIPVIIGCVDNNRTRQLIYDAFVGYRQSILWIDSGNEEYNGQVVVGYNNRGELGIAKPAKDKQKFYLPCVADIYPDILEDKTTKFISEMSCAERAVHHPQCIATNITAGNIIFNIANTLISKTDDGIKVGMVTFNTRINGFKHHLCTEAYLEQRYKSDPVQAEPQRAAG